MKFQKYEAFETHFKEAFPDYLSPIYIVICPNENERKKILAFFASHFQEAFDFKSCTLFKDSLEHMNSGSLLSQKTAACYDGLDFLVKTEWESLLRYVSFPSRNSYLLLGSSMGKNLQDIYKKGKKEIVVLDLSTEKPWQQKQRIEHWVIQVLQMQKKHISKEALQAFFQRLPMDRLILQQEIDKLLCYIGEREEITSADVEQICSISLEQNIFQIAQELIWSQEKKVPLIEDTAYLFPLIAQLRNQLETGLKMASLLEKGIEKDEISKAFPRLWSKGFQQCFEGTQRKGMLYFQLGLMHLFDLECDVKMSKAKSEILFTEFCTKLHIYYTDPPYHHLRFPPQVLGQNAFL